MSDVAGAAPAAAESIPAPAQGAPINENQASYSEPLGSQIPPDAQAKPEPKAPPSIDDAIDRAAAKSAAKAAEAKPEAKAAAEKPEVKADAKPVRNEATGQFAPKDKPADSEKPADAAAVKPAADTAQPAKSTYEAPKRFSEDAKKVWETAPEPVKHEVARMERELTAGIEKHRERAEKWDSLKELDELATRSGTTVKDAMTRYVVMEQKIRTDLLGGLDEVISKATDGKYSLREIAAHVMGQTPEQVQSESDATIRELKATVQRLEQQVGGVAQTITQQREQSTLQEVTKFAETHPRFEDLADDIGFFMQSGRAKNLSEAYELAERLNPAPASAAPTPVASSAPAAKADPSVQPDKGQKSINGAPSASLSSNSGKKRVARSLDDALDHAFGAVG